MQPREKLLAALVGAMVLLFVIVLAAFQVRAAFASRSMLINGLTATKARMEELNKQHEDQGNRLDRLAERALPADVGAARRLYHQWLDSLVHKKGIDLGPARVTELEPTTDKGGFTRLKFQVIGEGTTAQWVAFLYAFYQADHLHKITNLVAVPKKDSSELTLTITIEALSLPSSKNKDKLSEAISPRLNHQSPEAYLSRIYRRNFFGYNKKPELSVARPLSAVPGKEFRYTLRGNDPERGKLTYTLISSKANGLRLSPDGQISWDNAVLGSYPLVVRVEDDGDPPLSDQKTITINVQKPKERPPAFNHLQFAILEGLLLVGDTPEAWVTVRTTDKHHKLHVGDEVEIAGVKVKVLTIDLEKKTMEAEVNGYRRIVRLRESLAEGREGV